MPRRKQPEKPPKRSYGQGSIYQRQDGRWVVQFRSRGVRAKPAYFASETAARRWHREQLLRIESGSFTESSQMPLDEYLERWIAGRSDLRPSSRESYTYDAKRLEPLGKLRLGALKPVEIERFLHQLLARGLAPSTVRHTRTLLSAALRDAVRLELIPSNPAVVARTPRQKSVTRIAKAWNGEQSQVFLRHSADDRLAALWMLFLVLGCRNGEVRRLRWADFDQEARTLKVGGSLSQRSRTDGPPKTVKGERTLPLTEDLVAVLRRHRVSQLKERMQSKKSWSDSQRIFTLENGKALTGDAVRRRWAALVEQTKLPEMRVHDCRHSAASWMLSQGVPVAAVAHILGHAHPGITYSTYAHLLPSDTTLALQAMAALTAPLRDPEAETEHSGG